MAKKFNKPFTTPATPVSSTPVRSTPLPPAAPARKAITQADIARRAYEIWQSGKGGTELENWTRAERELRGL